MSKFLTKQIHTELEGMSNPYRKEKIAGYLKTSALNFIGVELPQIHRTVKKHIKDQPTEQLPVIMRGLWKIETFETRLAAIDVLKVFAKKGPVEEALNIADSWIDSADTWAIIDPLCSPCIGLSDNFWRRRASVLPFLHLALKSQYKTEFNAKILEAVTPHISDNEFFVGKAAGWVLRELSKRDPDLVREYFEKYNERMTKLVIREGSKKL
ncbi:MAG: DNA alkylation repair protein [Candidatus Thorarchaeota archaeon]|jgi:3-methyladenine DNA glycosylase AlkD